MQKANAPTRLTVAFASGSGAGPVNTVPLTPGATAGTASYQTGFTSVNMEPIASGGIPPFGADFNGLFQDATKVRIWQQAGYTWTFDSDFASDTNIGGYPAGSVLMMGSGNGLWINQTDNNEQSPDATGSAGWIGLPAAGTYTINTTGGTTTPDPSVLGVTTLLVSGTLTSNAVLVLPLTAGMRWIVANNTTGSFTLTVQGSTGSGVAISQGSALTVFTDGTNYYAASANLSGAYLPIDGTAVAATKLATARSFIHTGFVTAATQTFDGTGNVIFNVTGVDVPGALGYTPVNKAGDTFTGQVNVTTSGSNQSIKVTDTGGAGACIRLVGNGSTTPSKTLSCVNGAFKIANDAFTTNVLTLSDAGDLTINGSLTYTTSNATLSDSRLKRNIRKANLRPLHRHTKFVSYTLKDSGWHGLGSIAQNVKLHAPEYVGTFEKNGKTYLSLNYTGMAFEQSLWAGQEVDRLSLRLGKLERALKRAKIVPRKRGLVRRLLEAVW